MQPCDYVIEDEMLIDNLDALRMLLDPVQIRLIRALQERPRSLDELASAMNIPPGRALHYVRRLVEAGVASIVEPAVESPRYMLRARVFLLDRRMFNPSSAQRQPAIETVSYLICDATRADFEHSIRAGVVDLEKPFPSEDSLMARRIFYSMTAERARWFQIQLRELLYETLTLSQQDEGEKRDYNVTFLCYPTAFFDGECDEAAALI